VVIDTLQLFEYTLHLQLSLLQDNKYMPDKHFSRDLAFLLLDITFEKETDLINEWTDAHRSS
jgi:hypothetical protein